MPRKHFSGITTLDDLKGRCIVDDLTGCWHWQGATVTDRKSGKRTQRLWIFDALAGEFRVMSGPMAVVELAGKRAQAETMGWRACRCDDCMNPAHMMSGTKREWGNWVRSHGHWKHNPKRTAANRRINRERSDLDLDTVRKVRAAAGNNIQIGAEFGLDPSHVSMIRLHKIWKESVVPGASAFTLGAL